MIHAIFIATRDNSWATAIASSSLSAVVPEARLDMGDNVIAKDRVTDSSEN